MDDLKRALNFTTKSGTPEELLAYLSKVKEDYVVLKHFYIKSGDTLYISLAYLTREDYEKYSKQLRNFDL